MSSFLHLPNELVYRIASYVMPEDIENFSVASKWILGVAWPFLQEHRELKKRYAAFDNIGKAAFDGRRLETSGRLDDEVPANCPSSDSFSNLLTEVLTNQRVARYIKELRLEGWSHGWYPETFELWKDDHTPHTEEQLSLFKQALSIYVLPEKLETWIKELELGSENPIISLLLILLPNINSIIDKDFLALRHILRDVAERIKTDCIKDITVLNRLGQINLGCSGRTYDVRSINLLAFAATIPSLNFLYSKRLITRGDAHNFSCLLPKSSNITTLCFKRCRPSIEQLQDLLQGLKSLRTFGYIYEYDMDGSPWDPAGMCNVLLQHARGSLEVLDLRGRSGTRGPFQGLQHFEALKDLVLSFSLFQVSQLPASIRKISLHDFRIRDILSLADRIREVVRFKSDRFPGLEKVCLCSHWDLRVRVAEMDELRDLCEGAGFGLRILRDC